MVERRWQKNKKWEICRDRTDAAEFVLLFLGFERITSQQAGNQV